jgi:hypothetical protein
MESSNVIVGRLLRVATFAAAAVPLVVILSYAAAHGWLGRDFTREYLPAAHAVVHLKSPFQAEAAPPYTYPYPPLLAFLTAPFLLIPSGVGAVLAALLSLALVPLTLWLLGVRDWQCYAIAPLWLPVIVNVQAANATMVLLFATALLWRLRGHPLAAGLVAGTMIAIKPFYWPMLLFFAFSNRRRAAGAGVASAAALIVVPWSVLGFAGVRFYPHLLAAMDRDEGPHSSTIAAALKPLVGWPTAQAFGLAVGICILGWALRVPDERRRFILTIGATLALTPVAGPGYFALLLVVAALSSAQLSAVWMLPAGFFAVGIWAAGAVEAAFGLLLAAASFAIAVRRPDPVTNDIRTAPALN